jgi:hypothetical protein
VVWFDIVRAQVRGRVSDDQGATFGDTFILADTIAEAPQPVVAVGNGVIYAAYYINETDVRLRRSLDGGVNWSSPAIVANNGGGLGLDIAAAGDEAYVAYGAVQDPSRWVGYRRSTDKGANWSNLANLTSPTGKPAFGAHLSLKAGTARATFDRCFSSSCLTGLAVWYRQSSNGTSWSTAERVSQNSQAIAIAAGVGFAGRIITLYTGYGSLVADVSHGNVFARTAN